jgi:hypothetical protein
MLISYRGKRAAERKTAAASVAGKKGRKKGKVKASAFSGRLLFRDISCAR